MMLSRKRQAIKKKRRWCTNLMDDWPCLCEYNITWPLRHGKWKNMRSSCPTLEILGKTAVSHARAGAISLPLRYDGRLVGAITQAHDETDLRIHLCHMLQVLSVFYGPFREALALLFFGDQGYHTRWIPGTRRALREVHLNIEEGCGYYNVKRHFALSWHHTA